MLATYERALTRRLGVLLRAGFAFGDTPPTSEASSPFFPAHVEIDARYWFGRVAYGRPGFQGYVFAGGGVAEFVARTDVDIVDCPLMMCPSGTPSVNGTPERLAVYRRGGRTFATAGGGALWAFDDSLGVFARAALVLGFPATVFVVEPSLGLQTGF